MQGYLRSWTTAQIKTRAADWTGANYERWSNREYDDLFAQLQRETDDAKRSGIVILMNDILVRDVVVVPLVARKAIVGFAKSLKGYNMDPGDSWLRHVADWSR